MDSVRKVVVKINVASLQGHFLITWEGARVSYMRTGQRRPSTCPAAVIWAGPTHPWMRSWPGLQPGEATVRTDRRTWGSRACGPHTLLTPQTSQGPLWTPTAPLLCLSPHIGVTHGVTCLPTGLHGELWEATRKVPLLVS